MNKYKKGLAWALLIFWLLLIFFFSSQNGTSSSEVSNGLLKIIEYIFHISTNNLSFIIRKLAHFTLYLILALLVINVLKQYYKIDNKKLIIVLLICLIYAVSDEFHQSFVDGRSSQIKDVFIDFSGSFVGCLIIDKIIKKSNINNI